MQNFQRTSTAIRHNLNSGVKWNRCDNLYNISCNCDDTLTGKNLLPQSKLRAEQVVTGQPSSLIIALRKANIVYNFGLSECNRVKG